LAAVVASKYLVNHCGGFGVEIQLGRLSLQASLLEAIHKVAEKLVSIFLPALPELLGNHCT